MPKTEKTEKPKVVKPRYIKWEKPSGILIVTNTEDATIEKAVELQWKRVKDK